MHDSEVLCALEQTEQAAGSLWALIDDVSTLFAEYSENARDDVASHLKVMRRSYAPSLAFLRRLQEFKRTVCDRIEQFAQNVGKFENHISCTALNYGLNLLPDDVLCDIFVLTATTMEEKVALSLVCKRFRSVMMSMRKMWDGYRIASYQSPEQIVAIAEGNGFASLKAEITSPSGLPSSVKTWATNRKLDFEESRIRYFKFSVGLIISFGPEELEIHDLEELHWKEIDPILAIGNMQNPRNMVMLGAFEYRTCDRPLLEKWHMPRLQTLEVDCVPGAALESLVQCRLDCRLGEFFKVHIGYLREFLAAAKSLQDLRLFIPEYIDYEVCDSQVPSLRSLEVDFVPHPSIARHLVRFRLSVPSDPVFSVYKLLNFISSAEALQELVIAGDGWNWNRRFREDPYRTIEPPVSMPTVVSCEVLHDKTGPPLVAKLHMPMLRTLKLKLRGLGKLSRIMRSRCRTSLQVMSSLEDLELKNDLVDISDIDNIVRYAPPHLESFSLKGCRNFFTDSENWDASPVPRRTLIRFVSCSGIFLEFMPAFVGYLRAVGLGGMKLQFSNCTLCRDGTFGLDDVMSAMVIA